MPCHPILSSGNLVSPIQGKQRTEPALLSSSATEQVGSLVEQARRALREPEEDRMSADQTVAVLGTGRMGAAMVRTLRRSGFDVVVYSRTVEPAHSLAAISRSTPETLSLPAPTSKTGTP